MSSAPTALKQCCNCGSIDEPGAKFCTHCGASQWQAVSRMPSYAYGQTQPQTQLLYPQHPSGGTPTLILPEKIPDTVPSNMARAFTHLSDNNVPGFAHIRHIPPEVMKANQVELAKLLVLLAREKLFLLFHFGIFAVVNAIGFALALKCYNEFIGDEMTKIMIACTPFWVFNVIGLNSIKMISNTRKQITRLKEQVAHQRFKIDYGHLI